MPTPPEGSLAILFIVGGLAVLQPPVVLITVLATYLLWADSCKYLGLLQQSKPQQAYAT